jgi:hypothetical protein
MGEFEGFEFLFGQKAQPKPSGQIETLMLSILAAGFGGEDCDLRGADPTVAVHVV